MEDSQDQPSILPNLQSSTLPFFQVGSVPDFRQTLKVFETFRVYPKIWDAPFQLPLLDELSSI
jgi:hypothetical protein